jgi:hypothetical protein
MTNEGDKDVAEGGPFSYGKPPRKGSVAANAEQKRKEQDRKTPPIEPKDQRVGNAKITKGVAEGSDNLNYIGNCTDDDVIEHIFGDATNFAQAVEEHGDEFTINDLVVKYDPKTDIHSFYYKQQGVAEGNLKEFAPYSSRDDDGDSRDIDPLREKIYSLLMKKLANVKGNPQDIAMAAMEVADDIASESEFVDFTKLPKWVEMVLNKVQGMAEGEVVRFPGKSRDNSPLGTVARALGGKIDAEDSPKYEFDIEVKRIPQGWAIFRAGVKQDVYDDPDRAHEAAKEIEDVIRDEEEQLNELKCWPGYHRVKGTKEGFPGSCAKNTSEGLSEVDSLAEDLHKWFKEKWVRFGPDGKIRGDCARGSDSEGKPKCLPQKKAHALGKEGRASAAARKRRQDPNPERSGKAKNVATKKKK